MQHFLTRYHLLLLGAFVVVFELSQVYVNAWLGNEVPFYGYSRDLNISNDSGETIEELTVSVNGSEHQLRLIDENLHTRILAYGWGSLHGHVEGRLSGNVRIEPMDFVMAGDRSGEFHEISIQPGGFVNLSGLNVPLDATLPNSIDKSPAR
ncbi:MAG: hypothetical protein U0892_19955 [Pirellulales bacterium]